MGYDSWVMSQRNIFKNVPAQSCPISLGTNPCRYHGAVVSIPFQMKFEVNDHVEITPLYLKINLVQKLRALSGWIFLTKYPVCCDTNIKVFGQRLKNFFRIRITSLDLLNGFGLSEIEIFDDYCRLANINVAILSSTHCSDPSAWSFRGKIISFCKSRRKLLIFRTRNTYQIERPFIKEYLRFGNVILGQ